MSKNTEIPTPETHVRCPDCRELVYMDASVCKHCNCVLVPQGVRSAAPKRNLKASHAILVLIGIGFLSTIMFRSNKDKSSTTVDQQISPSPFDLCVTRGVEYFKSVGSYPALSDGRSPLLVAQERCERTKTAF